MRSRVLNLLPEFGFNLLAPWAAFTLVSPHYGATDGLIASALPPLAWSAFELVRARRIDAVSALVLAGILLTLAATALGGSPRLLQIRENAVTGLIGLIFLATLGMRRPLIYHLARATFARQNAAAAVALEALIETRRGLAFFRRLTLFWGVGLVLQTALMIWLAFVWPIGRFLLLSPVIGYSIFGAMIGLTFWYRRGTRLI